MVSFGHPVLCANHWRLNKKTIALQQSHEMVKDWFPKQPLDPPVVHPDPNE